MSVALHPMSSKAARLQCMIHISVDIVVSQLRRRQIPQQSKNTPVSFAGQPVNPDFPKIFPERCQNSLNDPAVSHECRNSLVFF